MSGSPKDHRPRPVDDDIHSTVAVPSSGERIPVYPYHTGETILPGYKLQKRLGSGGFGEVWRASAPGDMAVAIKILANLGRAQGGREYRALQTIKNIRHAHIVPLFGVWLKSGDGRVLGEAELAEAEQRLLASRGGDWRPEQGLVATVDASSALTSLELIIAMGLGDQTLHDRLRDHQRQHGQPLPVERLVAWLDQAALALDHFNAGARRGGENLTAVQHCDIKPQNMLLVGDAVQVCDFGLARAQGEVRATSNTMASMAYAAPEIVSGRCEPSPTTDQYSLAVSYVELRTGRLPYKELAAGEILRAKLDGTLDLSALPPAERRAVGRALAVDPAGRWSSCVEFIRALRAATQAADAVAVDEPAALVVTVDMPTPPGAETRRPGRLVALAGGLVLAALGGYAAVTWWPGTPTVEVARSLERQGRYGAAGDAYAGALAGNADALAAALWDLQTQAADAGRPAECIPLLRRLERLYAVAKPPVVKGISRWDVVNSLAWYLATDRTADGAAVAEAGRLAEESLALATANDEAMLPQALDTAAAAAARAGSFAVAIERMQKAIDATTDAAMRADFQRRQDAYEAGQPWDEP